MVHLLDGLDYTNWNSAVSHYSYAFISPPITPAYHGVLPTRQGDVNGDGFDDLTIAGSDIAGADAAISIFYSPQSLSGLVGSDSSDFRLTGAMSYPGAVRISTDIDFDGNGHDELFFADLRQGSYNIQYDLFFDIERSAISHVSNMSYGSMMLEDARSTELHRNGYREFVGAAMAGADLDLDGDEELLFSIPGYDAMATNAGCVFIFNGGGVLSNIDDLLVDHSMFAFGGGAAICSLLPGDYLGWGSAPVLADFDADGALDLAIAASGRDTVFVFLNAASLDGVIDPDLSADIIIDGVSTPDWFGYALVAGDFDGDGHDDLAVGAPGLFNPIENAQGDGLLFQPSGFQGSAPPSSSGAVYVYKGQFLSQAQTEDDAQSIVLGSALDLFGMVLSSADLSGDGLPELIVGSPRFAGNQGRISVYSGIP